MSPDELDLIGQWISSADSLVIASGAGMGVDSGLPDFRGNEGFWQAYPALGQTGMDFTSIANGQTFICDPVLAWGFLGTSLEALRSNLPAGRDCPASDPNRFSTLSCSPMTNELDLRWGSANRPPIGRPASI